MVVGGVFCVGVVGTSLAPSPSIRGLSVGVFVLIDSTGMGWQCFWFGVCVLNVIRCTSVVYIHPCICLSVCLSAPTDGERAAVGVVGRDEVDDGALLVGRDAAGHHRLADLLWRHVWTVGWLVGWLSGWWWVGIYTYNIYIIYIHIYLCTYIYI